MRAALYSVTAALLVIASLALAEPATTSAQGDWQRLQSWPGTGSGATDPFDASGGELRVNWLVQSAPAPLSTGGASIQIQVYQVTTPSDTLVNTINAAGPGGQMVFTPPAAGQYFLQITPITGSLPQWTVRVDQRAP
jgi:hypothetical protein